MTLAPPRMSLALIRATMSAVSADGLVSFELIRQICEPPGRQALVGPAAIAFGAALYEQLDRRAPVERRKREVERAPISILAIDISPQLRKRRRHQPFAARTPEIGNRSRDVGERQMHQTVTAQDCVGARQGIARDV